MAAVIVTNRQENVLGSVKAIFATVTATNSGDTWQTGLAAVLWQVAEPQQVNAFATVKGTGANAGRITFTCTAGDKFDVIAFGRR